jgi:hypothetical protein
MYAGRPSPDRDALTSEIEGKLRGPRFASLLAEAADLEHAIVDG